MTNPTITATMIQNMVAHWLNTPVNGYFGSTYGSDVESLIQKPQNIGLADAFIAKLKKDVPILAVMNESDVSLYFQNDTTRFDAKKLIIQIGNVTLTVDALRNIT